MKKTILIAFCCASLILVTPLTGVAQQNQVSSNLPEQPNDVEGLVAQIRVVIDEILEKYGHIPMVSSLCNMIQSSLGLIGTIVFCIFLFLIILSLVILFFLLLRLDLATYSFVVILLFLISYSDRYCNPLNSFNINLPFQSIYTMSETKDNINTFDGCPCLQE